MYHAHSSRFCGEARIFTSQPIHGIRVCQTPPGEDGAVTSAAYFLAWGARLVSVLPWAFLKDVLDGAMARQHTTFRAPDWVYDAALSPFDPNLGVLVTAHNEVLNFRILDDGQRVELGNLISPSRPNLYCARVSWEAHDHVLVVGGTVFGEIVVWKCNLGIEKRDPPHELLFVLAGHEGSVFGVALSPEINLAPDRKVRLLASCSDDRTIRIWDITNRHLLTETTKEQSLPSLGEARETGFGSEAKIEPPEHAPRSLAVKMCHLSRIWQVRFSGRRNHWHSSTLPIVVYSFGEDRTVQRWELGGNEAGPSVLMDRTTTAALPSVLKPTDASSFHSGKNIWSTASFLQEDGTLLTATGGADGGVALLEDVRQSDQRIRNELAEQSTAMGHGDVDDSVSFERIHQAVSQGITTGDSATDTIKVLIFLSLNQVMLITGSARVLVGTGMQATSWEKLEVPSDISSHLRSNFVVRRPREHVLLFGTKAGCLYLFKDRVFENVATLPAGISNMTCVHSHTAPDTLGHTSILVNVMGRSEATLLTVDISEKKVLHSSAVGLRKGCSAISASFCGKNLVLGSRVGDVFVYARSPSGLYHAPIWRRDCRTRDAVTSIAPLPGSSTSFITGCRDGKHRIYTIHQSAAAPDSPAAAATLSLSLDHETLSPLSMIEQVWFTAADGATAPELLLHGFRGRHFVVWSATAQRELARVDCAGGQRAHAFVADAACADRLRFVHARDGRVWLRAQERPRVRTLREGGHGRDVRAVAVAEGGLVATGSEDTTIRIWRYGGGDVAKRTGSLKCLSILEKHQSGVQCLRWLGADYLLSGGGNEEFYIWRVSGSPTSAYTGLAIVCEATYPRMSSDEEPRIMDFDVERDDSQDGGMVISLAMSNSALRSYRYSKGTGFVRLHRGKYTGACLTQVRHLPRETGSMSVLTASTDGRLTIWHTHWTPDDSEPGMYEAGRTMQIHQDCIKSLELVLQQGAARKQLLVITGGDDNALGFLRLQWDAGSDRFDVQSRSRIRSAHAAAITCVCAVGAVGTEERVVTVSNDQRTKLWGLSTGRESGRLGVALLDDRCSAVADPGDLAVIWPGRLMVVGVGMETWKLPSR